MRRYLAPIHARLATLEDESARARSSLRNSEDEHRAAVQRATSAETQLADLHARLAALQAAGLDTAELEAVTGMDPEARMQRLICREWLTTLQASDRSNHPLGGYRLAPKFVASVEDRRIATPPTRVAFACAMVACGRAAELAGLEPHPWREGKTNGGGDDPQAVRADGAKGCMCNLGHGRGAARLFYWVLPNGTIEFDSVRNHDAIARQ